MHVCKALGWGLPDIEVDSNGVIIDERINPDSIAFKRGYFDECSDVSYLSYLENYLGGGEDMEMFERFYENGAELDLTDEELFEKQILMGSYIMFRNHCKERSEPTSGTRHITHQVFDGINFNQEKAGRNVFVVTPFTESDSWVRRNDSMDYYSILNPDEFTGELKILDVGMYPYSSLYMDKRNGRKLDNNRCHYLERLAAGSNCKKPGLKEAAIVDQGLDLLAVSLGFSNYQQACENIIPAIPVEVKNMMEWLNVFTDDKVWLQMRPMIYTYFER